ncbi:MAG: LysR family transcriptional regulator [Deltaproteobacteria bacterium]|nr:LysR family transcriptional regulator [Deltaproteobacteria bacterium]
MTSLLNLNQLRVFHFVAEYGQISLAAEKLMVTPSAVSMQLKALEEHYEASLFMKVSKRLELTETGLRLYRITEKLFGLVEEADRLLTQAKDFPVNILNVGVSKTFFHSHFIPFVSKFQGAFPDVRIHINEGHSEEMMKSVLHNRNDLAIVGRVKYPDKIQFIHLLKGVLFLIVPAGHRLCERERVSIADLDRETLILKEKGSGTRMLIQNVLEGKSVFPRVVIETGNDECIAEIIKAGGGITIMAREGLNHEIEKGHLMGVPMLEEKLAVPIDVIFRKGKTLSPAAHVFIERIIEEMGESTGPISPDQSETEMTASP